MEDQERRKKYAAIIAKNSGMTDSQIRDMISGTPENIKTEVMRWLAWYGRQNPAALLERMMEQQERLSKHLQSIAMI